MERTFDAPRARVFEVYTDPKLIPLWWGPRRYTTTVDKMDVRPGGVWRYISRGADGTEFAFHGTYREIKRPERLVSTFEFEGMPGHVIVDTATFEERGGKTKGTVTSRFESVEDRGGMLKCGVEEGAAETGGRLAGNPSNGFNQNMAPRPPQASRGLPQPGIRCASNRIGVRRSSI